MTDQTEKTALNAIMKRFGIAEGSRVEPMAAGCKIHLRGEFGPNYAMLMMERVLIAKRAWNVLGSGGFVIEVGTSAANGAQLPAGKEWYAFIPRENIALIEG